jgi:parallel beta-helix repeat protein
LTKKLALGQETLIKTYLSKIKVILNQRVSVNKKTLLAIALLSLLFSTSMVYMRLVVIVNGAATLHVYPGDSIQQVVNSAQNGDTIFVHAGTYPEMLVLNKTVSLIGINNPLIEGNASGSVVSVNASNVVFNGFTIERISDYSNWDNGVSISGISAGCNVTENKITNNHYGIYVNSSSNNYVHGNNITENTVGIGLENASNNLVSANNVTDTGGGGIGLSGSSNNIISANSVANNGYSGIALFSSTNNTISGNNLTANGNFGILLMQSSGNSLFANNVANSQDYYGVWLDYSSNNIVSGNNLNNNQFGVHCNFESLNNVISANKIANNSWGVLLGYSSPSNTVTANTLSNNVVGIDLFSSDNIISKNNVTNNEYAIAAIGSSNNSISANNITNNSNYGVWLDSSSNNTVNNAIQVFSVNSTNTWDDGYPSGGNYWSDYSGIDANYDGIGDTPYIIDANNQDNYPLMKLFAQLKTWTVDDDTPADFSSIQQAINAADSRDIVYVGAGIYHENVILNKTLTLIGENSQNTIIRGNASVTLNITANSVTVTGFTITGASTAGIEVTSNYTSITGNTITNNSWGLHVHDNYNNITQNNIANNSDCGIGLKNASFTRITGNAISGSNGAGIDVRFSSNNIFRDNDVNVPSSLFVILLVGSPHNIIAGNNLIGGTNDLIIQCGDGSDYNEISENNIIGFGGYVISGIALFTASNCNISKNNVTNCWEGIGLLNPMGSSMNNTVSGNFITANQRGIRLIEAVNNTISENDITVNTVYGIGSDNLNLQGSSNNTIYHNNFVGNAQQANSAGGNNTWDNGYPSGGNYWDDYIGTDANGDGIGDIPYEINENNTDRYPLMFPFGTSPPPTPTPSPSPSPSPSPIPTPTPQPTATPTPTLSPSPEPTPTPSPEPQPEPKPFPTILVATASASVVVVSLGVLVYFKKRKH